MSRPKQVHISFTILEINALGKMCHESYYETELQHVQMGEELKALTRAMNKIQDAQRTAKVLSTG